MSGEYTGYRAFAAEGARVGIYSCLTCGAALLLDPYDTVDVRALHDAWHEQVRPADPSAAVKDGE